MRPLLQANLRVPTQKMEGFLLDDGGDLDLGKLPSGVIGGSSERMPTGTIAQLHRDLDTGTLFSALRTRTLGGEAMLSRLSLAEPCNCVDTLAGRQAALRALKSRADGTEAGTLSRLAEVERDVLWLFSAREDEAMRAVLDGAYFSVWPLRMLNSRSPLSLSALNAYRIVFSPVVGVLSPIIYCIVPYLVLCWRLGRAMALSEYVRLLASTARERVAQLLRERSYASLLGKGLSMLISIALWFHGTMGSFQLSSTLRSTCSAVARRTERALEFLRGAAELRMQLWTPDLEAAWFPLDTGRWIFERGGQKKRPEMVDGHGMRRWFTDIGVRLHQAATFDYDAAARELAVAYRLDALLAVARSVDGGTMTWASYLRGAMGSPAVSARGLVHPGLDPSTATPNDWHLGVSVRDGGLTRARRKDVLLTGPNAGGKSTLMRALLSAVLLAQTLTVAPCSGGLALTPFSLISSHIGVADRTGSESLFQAEMARAANALRDIAGSDGLALVVIDEVFSSTNHVEGASAAAAVARRLAASPRTLSVVSTHFAALPRMLRLTHSVCGMPVELDTASGAVTRYPYQLKAGLCRQYIALELMRASERFDGVLVDDAIAVRKLLEGRSKPDARSPPSLALGATNGGPKQDDDRR